MKNNLAGRGFYVLPLAVFCFFAGVMGGTIWINLMKADIKEQLGVFGQAWLSGGLTAAQPEVEYVFPLVTKRGLEAAALWLLGMTLFAVPGFLALTLFAGFAISSVISLMTIQMGILGLPFYLLSIFPQALFYGPVFAVLFFWAVETQKKIHGAGSVILLFAVIVGAMGEALLNPWFMKILSFIP